MERNGLRFKVQSLKFKAESRKQKAERLSAFCLLLKSYRVGVLRKFRFQFIDFCLNAGVKVKIINFNDKPADNFLVDSKMKYKTVGRVSF
jgi:hypothetical protein